MSLGYRVASYGYLLSAYLFSHFSTVNIYYSSNKIEEKKRSVLIASQRQEAGS